MNRWFLFFISLTGMIFLSACKMEEVARPKPGAIEGEISANESITEIAKLSQAQGMYIFEYGEMINVYRWTTDCSLPGGISKKLLDLWGRATVCRTKLAIPEGGLVCDSLPQPYVQIFTEGEADKINFSGSGTTNTCMNDVIGLCDENDQKDLVTVLNAIKGLKNNFKCL